MCVLLVDDEPTILLWVEASLREAGHDVMSAADGSDAMDLIEQFPGHFSVLVTDYTMPGGVSGTDLVVHMRERFPTIPMIIATAVPKAVPDAFRRQHSVHLLPKPYEAETLVKLVRGLLDSGKAAAH